MATVQQVRANTDISDSDRMKARIAELEAANKALEVQRDATTKPGVKIGEKGGISVYGLARFPVTLYAEQVPRFIGMLPSVAALILKGTQTVDGVERKLTYRSTEGETATKAWAATHIDAK